MTTNSCTKSNYLLAKAQAARCFWEGSPEALHYVVYALQSAKTSCPFYIGMSGAGTNSWNVLKRLRGHKSKARNGDTQPVYQRMRFMQASGEEVICSVICGGLTAQQAGQLETKLIREAPAGLLTNVCDVPRALPTPSGAPDESHH